MAITVGSVANFSSGQAVYHCSAMLDTNKVVLVYRDQNDSRKTKIVVGTVSGTSVSWGTAAVINSGYYLDFNKTGIATLSSRLVVVCFDDNSSTTSQVVACTISGTTVTVGTPISIGNSCRNPRISALSSTSFVLAYKNRTTSYGGTVVGTVSTRTITLGDFVSCGYDIGEDFYLYHTIIGLDSTHFVLSYQLSDYNYTVLGTISSGTTHSLGTRATIKQEAYFNGKIRVAKLSSTKFVYVYDNNKAVVCSYSGTTITVGSEQSLSNDIYTSSYAFDVDALSDTLIIIVGYGDSYKKFIAYTVDGTTLTKEGDAVNIGTGRPDNAERFYLSSLTSTKFSATWAIQSSYGQIVVADYAPPVVAPTVTTQSATNIATTSFTGNGNIIETGGKNATRRGFCYIKAVSESINVVKSPGTMGIVNRSSGDVNWINPDNAKTSDDTYSTVTLNNQQSHYLKATNFGFNIPENATDIKCYAVIEAKTANGEQTIVAKQVKNGEILTLGFGKKINTTESTIEIDLAYVLTSSDVNNLNTGFVVYIDSDITDVVSIDSLKIKVEYNIPDGGTPTIEDNIVYDDGDFGTGAYTKSITGLTAGTDYRVRAYAVNSAGTSYGTTVDVKTLSAFIPRTMWF